MNCTHIIMNNQPIVTANNTNYNKNNKGMIPTNNYNSWEDRKIFKIYNLCI